MTDTLFHPPRAAPTEPSESIYTVSQINHLIQQALTAQLSPTLLVEGEISNFRVYQKGHAFFTLKDSAAELPCVLWRDALQQLGFTPQDGLAVLAQGAVRLYEPQGKVQLYVSRLAPRGAGALELAFRQLCAKLRAEGLFEAARKRALPRVPRRVAIITSPTGDVLYDVLTTAWRRFPGLQVLLFPVAVQGAAAAGEIAAAIGLLNRQAAAIGGVDLILLVRGGGSLEDLWAFNEEIVARALAASHIPIATGIGHEPDTTIADLVADLRGPTPTGVAELTIPDAAALGAYLDGQRERLNQHLARRIQEAVAVCSAGGGRLTDAMQRMLWVTTRRVQAWASQVQAIEPRHAVAQGWRRLEDAQRRLGESPARRLKDAWTRLHAAVGALQAVSPRLKLVETAARFKGLEAALRSAAPAQWRQARLRLAALQEQLQLASPRGVLERGFSITMDDQGRIVRRVADAAPGRRLTTRVVDGVFRSVVEP